MQKNNVRVTGSGTDTIIFAHGFGCDQHVWDTVIAAFERDYRVVCFDLMGSGGSDLSQLDDEKYAGLEAYAQDLLDICHCLNLRNAIYVGHSVSGMIGILAAIQSPETFRNLVLIGASPCYFNDGSYTGGLRKSDIDDVLAVMESDYRAWSAKMAPILVGSLDRPELAAELCDGFCRLNPQVAIQFARTIFVSDYRAALAKLSVPALILQCELDPLAGPAVGAYLHRHLAGSQLACLQATGHYPHLSAPQEIIDHIRSYLAEMAGKAPAAKVLVSSRT